MIGQFWLLLIDWKLNSPYSLASVCTTPTRFRVCSATVHSERTNSYSTGMPRSMKGMITFCRPDVKATPMKMFSRLMAPRVSEGTWRPVMP